MGNRKNRADVSFLSTISCIHFSHLMNSCCPVLSDFTGELVYHLPQLVTDEYGIAVFNLVRSHKGVAVLLQFDNQWCNVVNLKRDACLYTIHL